MVARAFHSCLRTLDSKSASRTASRWGAVLGTAAVASISLAELRDRQDRGLEELLEGALPAVLEIGAAVQTATAWRSRRSRSTTSSRGFCTRSYGTCRRPAGQTWLSVSGAAASTRARPAPRSGRVGRRPGDARRRRIHVGACGACAPAAELAIQMVPDEVLAYGREFAASLQAALDDALVGAYYVGWLRSADMYPVRATSTLLRCPSTQFPTR